MRTVGLDGSSGMSVVEAKLRDVNLDDDACIERARGRVARRDMAGRKRGKGVFRKCDKEIGEVGRRKGSCREKRK